MQFRRSGESFAGAGIRGTLAVGLVGALLGGAVVSAASLGAASSLCSLTSWPIAIGGALALLVLYQALDPGGFSAVIRARDVRSPIR